jgi:hypothetical protein
MTGVAFLPTVVMGGLLATAWRHSYLFWMMELPQSRSKSHNLSRMKHLSCWFRTVVEIGMGRAHRGIEWVPPSWI